MHKEHLLPFIPAKPIIRKMSSLFFLGIFLWFYAVKDIHDIVHGDDFHCHVKDTRHFHPQEHHCPICDFVLPCYDSPSKDKLSYKPLCVNTILFTIEQNIALSEISSISSRGPPQVV